MRIPTSILAIAVLALTPFAALAESGVITLESAHSAKETKQRLEAGVEGRGLKVFGSLNHAEAAAEYDQSMPYSTVVVFGNPKAGTPNFLAAPTLAIDLPLKALIWEDADGNVFLTYNSAAYIHGELFERHGRDYKEENTKRLEGALATIMQEAAGN